ncbi:MAG: tetratricopeptide repeat protein, partial [Rhodocyclaceae bacterium]|nr:tetratricopeptide repeat protein [Rhodocyclaceae bacterium]
MFYVKKTVWTVCAAALGGCASYQVGNQSEWNVQPVFSVKHSTLSPAALYQLGRYYQGNMNYAEAVLAYERALAVEPGHVEARNGLGVIGSLRGRHEMALRHFEMAIELAPHSAHLHNNLGYAYLLQGRDVEAATAFEQALNIDPSHARARESLVVAYRRLGIADKAEMLAAAAPLPQAPEPPTAPETARTASVAVGSSAAANPPRETVARVYDLVWPEAETAVPQRS